MSRRKKIKAQKQILFAGDVIYTADDQVMPSVQTEVKMAEKTKRTAGERVGRMAASAVMLSQVVYFGSKVLVSKAANGTAKFAREIPKGYRDARGS